MAVTYFYLFTIDDTNQRNLDHLDSSDQRARARNLRGGRLNRPGSALAGNDRAGAAAERRAGGGVV